jgi:hypothetical protein
MIMDEVGGSFDHGSTGQGIGAAEGSGGVGRHGGLFALKRFVSRAEAGGTLYRVTAVLHEMVHGEAPETFLQKLSPIASDEEISLTDFCKAVQLPAGQHCRCWGIYVPDYHAPEWCGGNPNW